MPIKPIKPKAVAVASTVTKKIKIAEKADPPKPTPLADEEETVAKGNEGGQDPNGHIQISWTPRLKNGDDDDTTMITPVENAAGAKAFTFPPNTNTFTPHHQQMDYNMQCNSPCGLNPNASEFRMPAHMMNKINPAPEARYVNGLYVTDNGADELQRRFSNYQPINQMHTQDTPVYSLIKPYYN